MFPIIRHGNGIFNVNMFLDWIQLFFPTKFYEADFPKAFVNMVTYTKKNLETHNLKLIVCFKLDV